VYSYFKIGIRNSPFFIILIIKKKVNPKLCFFNLLFIFS